MVISETGRVFELASALTLAGSQHKSHTSDSHAVLWTLHCTAYTHLASGQWSLLRVGEWRPPLRTGHIALHPSASSPSVFRLTWASGAGRAGTQERPLTRVPLTPPLAHSVSRASIASLSAAICSLSAARSSFRAAISSSSLATWSRSSCTEPGAGGERARGERGERVGGGERRPSGVSMLHRLRLSAAFFSASSFRRALSRRGGRRAGAGRARRRALQRWFRADDGARAVESNGLWDRSTNGRWEERALLALGRHGRLGRACARGSTRHWRSSSAKGTFPPRSNQG
jgi:hypothetical protein